MKRKKFLALALAGVLMLTLLTGCSGGGTGEDRLIAEGVAAHFESIYQITEVSYSVPALTSTIRPAFTPDWFQENEEWGIYLDPSLFISSGLTLGGFLENSLKAYEQSNFVYFLAFDSTGMSASEQAERLTNVAYKTPSVTVYPSLVSVTVYPSLVSPTASTKLCVGVRHKTVEGREYCLVVVVRE